MQLRSHAALPPAAPEGYYLPGRTAPSGHESVYQHQVLIQKHQKHFTFDPAGLPDACFHLPSVLKDCGVGSRGQTRVH